MDPHNQAPAADPDTSRVIKKPPRYLDGGRYLEKKRFKDGNGILVVGCLDTCNSDNPVVLKVLVTHT